MARLCILLALLLPAIAAAVPMPRATAPVGQQGYDGLLALRLEALHTDVEVLETLPSGRRRLVATAEGRRGAGGWVYVRGVPCHSLIVRWRGYRGSEVEVSGTVHKSVRGILVTDGPADLERAVRQGLVEPRDNPSSAVAFAHNATLDHLPPQAEALRHLRHIILNRPGLERRPDLQAALAGWVAGGGTLVFTPCAVPASGSALSKLLPRPTDPHNADLAWRAVGRGYVARLTAPAQPDAVLWRRVALCTNLGATTTPSAEWAFQTDQVATALDPTPPLPWPALAAYLGGYLLALLALRRRLGWWGPSLLALAFVGLALGLARVFGHTALDAYQLQAASTVSGEQWAVEARTMALVGPDWQRCQWTQPALCWIDEPGRWHVSADGDVVASGPRLRPNSRRTLSSYRRFDLGGSVRVAVRWDGARLRGEVRNGLPVTLRGAVLVRDSIGLRLGDLPPGAERPIDAPRPARWSGPCRLLPWFAAPDLPPAIAGGGSGSRFEAPYLSGPALLAWIDPPPALAVQPTPRLRANVALLAVSAVPAPNVAALPLATVRLATPESLGLWRVRPYRVGPADTIRFDGVAPSTHVWLPREQRWLPIRGLREVPAARALNCGVVLVGWPGRQGEAGELKVRGMASQRR